MKRAAILRGAEAAAVGVLWAALVLGSAVLALTIPVYTSAMTQALGVPASSGLATADVVRLSGQVRAMVADAEYDPLPATWKGQPAFDRAAVSHLMDVRHVFAGTRTAIGIVALLLAGYVAFSVARRRLGPLARSMTAGAIVLGAGTVLAVLAGTLDFGAFFAAFHGLFFDSGTWTFPADSLLIRLLPERFWIASGVAWSILTLLGGVMLAIAGRSLRSAASHGNASRSANNV